jgi:hypothetical protein
MVAREWRAPVFQYPDQASIGDERRHHVFHHHRQTGAMKGGVDEQAHVIQDEGAVDVGVGAASGTNHGSRNVASNSSTCRKQSTPNASTNASDVTAGLGAADKRHPRKVAQSVVIVGPPRRCTMLREVVAIGRSRLLTEVYAAEMEGIPTALSPTPRTKRVQASTATLSP